MDSIGVCGISLIETSPHVSYYFLLKLFKKELFEEIFFKQFRFSMESKEVDVSFLVREIEKNCIPYFMKTTPTSTLLFLCKNTTFPKKFNSTGFKINLTFAWKMMINMPLTPIGKIYLCLLGVLEEASCQFGPFFTCQCGPVAPPLKSCRNYGIPLATVLDPVEPANKIVAPMQPSR